MYRYKSDGWIAIELIVGISILGILASVLWLSMNSFGKLNRNILLRNQCISAAQAQLDSMSVNGRSLDERDFERLWPGLKTTIEQQPGQEQWQGLTLVKITVTVENKGQKVQVVQCRYISKGQE